MRIRWRRPLRWAGIAGLVACSRDAKPVAPSAAPPNLRLAQVVFTQVTQDVDGTLPLVAGAPVAAKVLVVRSVETVDEVEVVLRLFRGGTQIHVDTARTGGVLGPTASLSAASAEFLVPSRLVSADVSWQVDLDPRQRQADSTRADNRLPVSAPERLRVISLPPIRLRLVPVVLARHDSAAGVVDAANAELYVRLARQLFPDSAFTVTVGAPVVTAAFFGAPPGGGDRGFWDAVLADVDRARTASGPSDEFWYGVLSWPRGYRSAVYGGFGFIPAAPASTGEASRSGAGFGIGENIDAQFAQQTLAHELGHNLGRSHTPGCGTVAPIDSLYPSGDGAIGGFGHDVWSWANGVTRGAQAVGSATPDVMTYCALRWIGPYTHTAVLQWRMGTLVSTRVTGRGNAVP
ncbi:MAG: hypothetical protein IT355_05905 [Gemmatimonadaceae bacterium]|nr:hypothetical protein [Gemmatimonadaceae bacterium]